MVSSCSFPKGNVLWQLYFHHKKINWHCSLYMSLFILINMSQPSQIWWTWYYWNASRICPNNAEDQVTVSYTTKKKERHCKCHFSSNVFLRQTRPLFFTTDLICKSNGSVLLIIVNSLLRKYVFKFCKILRNFLGLIDYMLYYRLKMFCNISLFTY